MPHSLYLGSGIVQPRLREYDVSHGHIRESEPSSSAEKEPYYPSLPAIKFCMKYSVIELAFALFTFALFVNSAILITAGASLSKLDDAADAACSPPALLLPQVPSSLSLCFCLAFPLVLSVQLLDRWFQKVL